MGETQLTDKISLHLPPEFLHAINTMRSIKANSISRNSWILEAISEKLVKDKTLMHGSSHLIGFYEFFAGGGMARGGLGQNMTCLLANDLDSKKAKSYTANWGCEEFMLRDVARLTIDDLPVGGELAWASFPCQDLSLAGNGVGLKGKCRPKPQTFPPLS